MHNIVRLTGIRMYQAKFCSMTILILLYVHILIMLSHFLYLGDGKDILIAKIDLKLFNEANRLWIIISYPCIHIHTYITCNF